MQRRRRFGSATVATQKPSARGGGPQRPAIMLPLLRRRAEPAVDIIADHLIDHALAPGPHEDRGVAAPAGYAIGARTVGASAIDEIAEGGAPDEELRMGHRLAVAGDERDERHGGDPIERAPPAFGAAIKAGDAEIGTVRSGADGRAIALIRLDRALELSANGARFTVEDREIRLDPPSWLILPSREVP